MSQTTAARPRPRKISRPTIVGLLAVTVAVIGTLFYQSMSSPANSFGDIFGGDDHGGTIAEADGGLPDGVTVFDDQYPGIANLEPDLRQALREAATDAADDGVEFTVNSGWRSSAHQNQLLQEAVSQYGSEKEAARWVATPDTSPHVSGTAIDMGSDARSWLSKHGDKYGLCQIYRNEPWHYELRPRAIDRGCPPMYADPTYDPRMQ